jgi:nucleotide-binding universal stress UspA family protein
MLFALDQYESGQVALDFVAELAIANSASVRVLHIREFSHMARVVPLETKQDADSLVADAVFRLRMLGIGASGRARAALRDRVAERILEESLFHDCSTIVLGSRRLRGCARLSAQGTRERLLRLSELPIVIAPTCRSHGLVSPAMLRRLASH